MVPQIQIKEKLDLNIYITTLDDENLSRREFIKSSGELKKRVWLYQFSSDSLIFCYVPKEQCHLFPLFDNHNVLLLRKDLLRFILEGKIIGTQI